MPFLREDQLINVARSFPQSGYVTASKTLAQVRIFLSHSHKDRELIEGFIKLFAAIVKVSIYVDWQDPTMPESTNRETADRIKRKINELDYFLILATTSALASRWVPWEIGIADTVKSANKMLVVPIADPSGRFNGNEYLQLYQRAEFRNDGSLGVFAPYMNFGIPIQSWILGNS